MVVEILAASAFAAVVAAIALRGRRQHDAEMPDLERWLERFSPDSYRPMLRLVEPRDASFLIRHRGPEEAARYQRLRRQMLRAYLRALSRDFHRLHALATCNPRTSRIHAGNSSLLRVEEKMEFIFSVWNAELRLRLNEIAPSAVNLASLVADVEQLAARARAVTRRRCELRLL